MQALKASIQTAATKVTNIGVRLSSGAGFGCGRKIAIYCWNDLRNRQNVLAFGGVVFAENGLLVIVHR